MEWLLALKLMIVITREINYNTRKTHNIAITFIA